MGDPLDRYIMWAERRGWPRILIATLPGATGGFLVGIVVNLLWWNHGGR